MQHVKRKTAIHTSIKKTDDKKIIIFIQSHPNNYFTGYLQNTYCFVGFLSKETLNNSIYKSCLHIFRTRPCKKHGSFFERVMKRTAQSHKFCLLAISLHILLYGFISSGTSYFSANFSAPKKKSAAFSDSTLCANFDLLFIIMVSHQILSEKVLFARKRRQRKLRYRPP